MSLIAGVINYEDGLRSPLYLAASRKLPSTLLAVSCQFDNDPWAVVLLFVPRAQWKICVIFQSSLRSHKEQSTRQTLFLERMHPWQLSPGTHGLAAARAVALICLASSIFLSIAAQFKPERDRISPLS
jgi:hypothetical protein